MNRIRFWGYRVRTRKNDDAGKWTPWQPVKEADPSLAYASSAVPMTASLLLGRAFCSCDGLCVCGWDEA